jgi:VWFA-related protein
MSTSRLVRSLVVAAGLCLLVGTGPGTAVNGQQAPPPPPPDPQAAPPPAPPAGQPTFRTDANFVLTDAFVTADGKPVTDLTIKDFEIKEDGVLQTIQSFEAVQHRPELTPLVPRREPNSVAESNAMIADPRRRVFVVFLDTYHVDKGSSMWARERLQSFLKVALGPDDLIAYMVPQMSGMDISFSTTTESLIRYFDENPVWGVQDEALGTETDAVERDLQTCFVGNEAAWGPIRRRLREQRTLVALHGLVANLDGLREARKAIIVVTGGWTLFTENPTLMSDKDTTGRVIGADPIGVGPDGRLGNPKDRNRIGGVTQNTCDATRFEGAAAESRQSFRDLIGEANRSSTSFYTVDVKGLRTETRPMPTTPAGAAIEARNRERMPYSVPSDSIRTLGEATNGMAIVDTNDIEKGLQRAAADFNSYYLLGYTSTNGKPDGHYRKIKVTVKRPGVLVRAREGYLARRPDESPTASPTAGRPARDPNAASEEAQVNAALGKLMPVRPGVPFLLSAASGAGASGTRVIRVVAELDSQLAATPEWAEGGEGQAFIRDLKGDIVTSGKGTLEKGTRTVEMELPVVPTMQGDWKVQVRLQGHGPLARYTDTTSVSLDTGAGGWGVPRLSRRGPSTGIAWVPTADPRFRRQERIRVTVGPPADAAPGTVAGALLDRQGKPMNIPVKVEQAEPTALVAELALAPLAAGDYVIALGGGPHRLLVPLRIVP